MSQPETSQSMSSTDQSQDLFTKVPLEITIDILSRLPIQTIISCKRVCNPWRNLLKSLDFAYYHLSKSTPHLFVFLGKGTPIPYKLFEFVDDEQNPPNRCNKVFDFTTFPHTGTAIGSVNGLLFMCGGDEPSTRHLYVCNPMTREYTKLPPPPKVRIKLFTAGVGASRTGGRYKVVRIYKNSQLTAFECQVHTVGTNSWRSFPAGAHLEYRTETLGAFVNGNLHWLVNDSEGNEWISCFDLESESFSTLASPSSPPAKGSRRQTTVSALEGRLCLCEYNKKMDANVVWLMKEYGDEKSWSMEVEIKEHMFRCYRKLSGFVFLIKLLKDGDILVARESYDEEIRYYLKETGAICSTGIHKRAPFEQYRKVATSDVFYTPTFLPLRSLVGENAFLNDDGSSFLDVQFF